MMAHLHINYTTNLIPVISAIILLKPKKSLIYSELWIGRKNCDKYHAAWLMRDFYRPFGLRTPHTGIITNIQSQTYRSGFKGNVDGREFREPESDGDRR